jgi:hypothetical protein
VAVNATAIWRVRPAGSNTNGAGFDAGISGAGTDYSQQNAAQASGTHGTASGSATFIDATANAFTGAMVGNALYLTGTGLTTGWYFVTAYTSASTVTLDRSPGTGTAGTWHLGGAWADFWNNTQSSGPLVPRNIVYILGSGISEPSTTSFDYDFTVYGYYFVPVAGNSTAGLVSFINDPTTPSNAYVAIKIKGACFYQSGLYISGIYAVATTSDYGTYGFYYGNNSVLNSCVLNQNGNNVTLCAAYDTTLINVEVFDSTGSSGGIYGITYNTGSGEFLNVISSNIHDCNGGGIQALYPTFLIKDTIIAKNKGDGVNRSSDYSGNNPSAQIINCTIDGNSGNGIVLASQADITGGVIYNNVISNHTGVGKYGISCNAGTAAENDRIKQLIDYNAYYNNSSDLNGLDYGAHDQHGGTNPFPGSSTENYTLASTYVGSGLSPLTIPQHLAGQTATLRSYVSPGAVQPQAGGGGTTVTVIAKTTNIFLTDGDQPYAA